MYWCGCSNSYSCNTRSRTSCAAVGFTYSILQSKMVLNIILPKKRSIVFLLVRKQNNTKNKNERFLPLCPVGCTKNVIILMMYKLSHMDYQTEKLQIQNILELVEDHIFFPIKFQFFSLQKAHSAKTSSWPPWELHIWLVDWLNWYYNFLFIFINYFIFFLCF